jgi:hypothetical protein
LRTNSRIDGAPGLDPARRLAISGLLCVSAIGAAQEAPSSGPYLQPCKADVAKFCKGVDPANEGIIGCLKDHREEVSDTCKARLAQLRVKTKPAPRNAEAPPAAK